MPDALLMVISVIILYSLFIILVATIKAKQGRNVSRTVFFHIAAMYFLCVIVSAFFPTQMSDRSNDFFPLLSIKYSFTNGGLLGLLNYISHQLLNIIIYIPLGIFVSTVTHLSVNRNMGFKTFVTALAVILIIEVVQIFLPYRAGETDDLIFGVLGAVVGFLIFKANYKSDWVKKRLSKILQ